MKKLCSFLLVGILCLGYVIPSFAYENVTSKNTETIISVSEKELGDGYSMKTVTTILKARTQFATTALRQSRTVKKTSTVEHGSEWVGSITLTANFGYNGSSSWVNSMNTSHNIASGWTYEDEHTWKNGATANMSAIMKKKFVFITITEVNPNISITCSPSGSIS